jgi:hypothetical protein
VAELTTDTPWVAASADELLAGATGRTAHEAEDGKSGSRFERVTIEGEPYFVKSLSRSSDWITRVIHDPEYWNLTVWQAGIMSAVPPEIDHTVVGMALDGTGDDAVLTMLMRDVGAHIIPEGDDPVTPDQHLALLDGLAALSARFWGWSDDLGLCTMANRFRFFAPDNIAPELPPAAHPDEVPVPIRVADEGWRALPGRAPELAEVLFAIHADPAPLVAALAETPSTFLHGDWKMGNLGVHPDGRTILLDWAYPGAGACCYDLGWYLALNRSRLPISKEATIAAFRDALEHHGIATDGWFDRQLSLCMLGIMATMAWEKAVGDDDELRWWEHAALDGARLL